MRKVLLSLLLSITFAINLNSQVAGNGLTDIDGNQYETVIIGNQEWMTTNLRVTKFTNNQSIQYQATNIADNTGPTNPRYFKEGNNDNNIIDKGLLYNWFAINNPNFVPNIEDGWRIPTEEDWEQLNSFVVQPPLLAKADGSITWNTTPDSNNPYGFSLLPTGGIGFNINNSIYTFTNGGNSARFWVNASWDASNSIGIQYVCNPKDIAYQASIHEKRTGRSIRLVRTVSLSTNSFNKANVYIYPNPSKDIINIETNSNVINIEIYDFLGKKILNISEKVIDISHFVNGVYIAHINTDDGVIIKKIIKK